jgi:antitoxin HigA-1
MTGYRQMARRRAARGSDRGLPQTEAKIAAYKFAPVTRGEILKGKFLEEYRLSQNQLAKAIGISPNRVAEIVNNRRRVTPDTALWFSPYFGNSPEFWLNLQTYYELKLARRKLRPDTAKRIKALRANRSLLMERGNRTPTPNLCALRANVSHAARLIATTVTANALPPISHSKQSSADAAASSWPPGGPRA